MAWPDEIPADLTYDADGGVKIPLREHPFVKESPDLGHFVNRAFQNHREVGARIPVKIERVRAADGTFAPNTEAVTAWRKDHLPKLYENGILEKPPATVDDYKITKPEKLPDGLTWNDDTTVKFKTILHKYGVPVAAAGELLQLHSDALLGGQKMLKTSVEAGRAALKAEHGDKYDERIELTKRLTPMIFKTEEELQFFEETGMADHPGFLSVMMRLAPLAASDNGIIARPGDGTPAMTGDQVRAMLADIMSNPQNPKHTLYKQNDPATMAEIDAMYKKVYPGTYIVS